MTTTTAAPHIEGASSPWWAIPRLAAVLFARHWPQLLFWFFLQRVLYDVLLDNAAIAVAGKSLLLAYAALAVLVVTQLATVIAMFLCLRPSLPVLSQRDVPQTAAPGNRWLHAVTVALLPFFAYYTTWGLLDGLRRQFQIDYLASIAFDEQVSLKDVLHLPWLWLALLVSAVIRHISKKRAESAADSPRGAGWPLLATMCEAYWVFVGARAIAQVIGMGWDWWHGRAAYVVLMRWWEDPRALFHLLAPIKHVLLPAWDLLTTAFGGVVLPLVWLAIAAIIYGMDLKRTRRLDVADQRLADVGARFSALPLLVRKLAGKASNGWTSKGVPVTNSLRLVLRAGLPAVVVLCVGYQALELVDAWAWRGAVHLLGPHPEHLWNVIGAPVSALVGGPLSTRPSLLTEPLRVVLLAATFDCAIARLGAESTVASRADG